MGKFFSFLLAVLALMAISVVPSLSAEKLRFGSSLRGTPNYDLPMLAAAEKGIWKENDVDVEWIPFRGAGDVMRAMAARAIDMGTTGASASMLAYSQGLPVIIVADPKQPAEFYFYVLRDSPIREAKDLRGARIGILTLGGTSHNYGRAVARALGLEREIKFVAGGGVREELAAMKTGALDGRVGSFYATITLVVRGEIRSVVAVTDYLPREWIEQVAIAHRDAILRSPELIKRGVRGFIQGGDYIARDRAWALAQLKGTLGVTDEEAAAIYPKVAFPREGGKISRRAVENARNFFIEYGVIPKDKAAPVDEFYTTRFTE